MIQTQRYFDAAIKLLLKKKQRLLLKEEAKFIIVDLNEDKEKHSSDENGSEKESCGISVRSGQINLESNEKLSANST